MTRLLSAQSLLVGLGAGIASALLFAALVGGSVLALPLFLLAPLPLAIAAFGWGTPAGVVAGLAAIGGVGFVFGTPAMISMFLADVLPTLVAVHYLGLARQTDPADPAAREWYPLGRVLTILSGLVMIGTVLAGIAIGFDVEETSGQVVAAYRDMMLRSGVSPAQMPDATQLEPFVRGTVRMIPAFFPATWVLILTFDLWAAAKVVRRSDRLARADEDVAAVELPSAAGLACVTALVVAVFLDGPIGTVAAVVAGALASAHLLVGLGVIHTLARRSPAKIIVLAFVYGLVLLFTLPAGLIALAGLVEPHIGLRRRFPPVRPA